MDSHGLRDAPLGRLLVVAGHLVAQQWNRRLAEEYGLTQAGLSTLMTLDRHGALTHRAVADHCFVRPATLTGIIDTLARDGLVVRHRDEADRRSVRLAITPAGRERIAPIAELIHGGAPLTSVDADPDRAAVIREFLLEVIGSGGGTPPHERPDPDQPEPGRTLGHPGSTDVPSRSDSTDAASPPGPTDAASPPGPTDAASRPGPEAGGGRC